MIPTPSKYPCFQVTWDRQTNGSTSYTLHDRYWAHTELEYSFFIITVGCSSIHVCVGSFSPLGFRFPLLMIDFYVSSKDIIIKPPSFTCLYVCKPIWLFLVYPVVLVPGYCVFQSNSIANIALSTCKKKGTFTGILHCGSMHSIYLSSELCIYHVTGFVIVLSQCHLFSFFPSCEFSFYW